jgi:hypothetical protein
VTLREALGVLFLLCGAVSATIAGFLHGAAHGFAVLGGLLLLLGLLLAYTDVPANDGEGPQ